MAISNNTYDNKYPQKDLQKIYFQFSNSARMRSHGNEARRHTHVQSGKQPVVNTRTGGREGESGEVPLSGPPSEPMKHMPPYGMSPLTHTHTTHTTLTHTHGTGGHTSKMSIIQNCCLSLSHPHIPFPSPPTSLPPLEQPATGGVHYMTVAPSVSGFTELLFSFMFPLSSLLLSFLSALARAFLSLFEM